MRSKVLALLLALYVLMAVGIALRIEPFVRAAQVDFNAYFAAARLLRDGQDPYNGNLAANLAYSEGIEYIRGSDYIYPPYLAAWLAPLAFVPPLGLGFLWFIISLLAFSCAIWLIVRSMFLESPLQCVLPKYRDALILTLVFVPTVFSFYVGQVNALLLLLLAGTLYFTKKDRDIIAGILLGTSILIKVAPAIFLLYYVGRGRWRAIVSTVVWMLLVIGITAQSLGRHLYTYFTRVLPQIGDPQPNPINQSLNGFFSRMLVDNVFTVPLFANQDLAQGLTSLASLALIMTLVAVLIVGHRASWLGWQTDLYFAQTMIVMVVISPLAWENLYLLLCLPLLTVFLRWNLLSHPQRFLFVIAVLLIMMQRIWDPFVNSPGDFADLRQFLLLMSLGLYGAFVLLWLQIRLQVTNHWLPAETLS